jgi:ribonuclease HII
MDYPNLQEEKSLWNKGFKRTASLDEAGRGPLAGPVVAGAVILNSRSCLEFRNRGIKDSKKLSAKKREKLYKIITKNKNIEWATGIVSEKTIDRINILEATKLAMEKAINKIEKEPDFLILDGKMKINLEIPQKSIVKADEKVLSCAMASILAKVTRDRIMMRYHKKHPKYRFDLHKGYPTKLHKSLLKKYGYCKIHRKTFRF